MAKSFSGLFLKYFLLVKCMFDTCKSYLPPLREFNLWIPDLCFSVDKMISYNYKVTCTQILCKCAQNVIDDNYIWTRYTEGTIWPISDFWTKTYYTSGRIYDSNFYTKQIAWLQYCLNQGTINPSHYKHQHFIHYFFIDDCLTTFVRRLV